MRSRLPDFADEADEAALEHAVRAGDEAAFTALVERYRRQLRVHCYRLLGSFDDAEDLVQETLLRAWRGRAGFEGRSLVPDLALPDRDERLPQRARARPPAGAARRTSPPPVTAGHRPVRRRAPSRRGRPSSPGCSRTPIAGWSPPRRATPSPKPGPSPARRSSWRSWRRCSTCRPGSGRCSILRDVLDWSARETAALLDTSVASVNSALQRARATMRAPAARARAPAGRAHPTATSGTSCEPSWTPGSGRTPAS